MSTEAEDLRREALALPDDQRADLAADLLASLDRSLDEDPATVRSLWGDEIGLRARQVMAGDAATEDWARIRQRLADELAG